MRPGHIENVGSLLRCQHLADRHEGDGIAFTNVPKQLDQQFGNCRCQNDICSGPGSIQSCQNLIFATAELACENLTKLICRRLLVSRWKTIADFLSR